MITHYRRFVSNTSFLFFLRLLLGGIFITASLGKISDPQSLVALVTGYNILPEGLA